MIKRESMLKIEKEGEMLKALCYQSYEDAKMETI